MNTNTPQEEMTLKNATEILGSLMVGERVFSRDEKAVDTALQHLETLKRDKERLDWLENQSEGMKWVARPSSRESGYRLHTVTEKWREFTGEESVRAAIDSAMAQTTQQKGEG